MRKARTSWIGCLSVASLLLTAGVAGAVNLGVQITISDNMYSPTSNNSWYKSPGEDQEVETNCVTDQRWDLEGFFLKGTTLTMVGGYDFKGGYGGTASGDIFIDVTGNAQYGPGTGGGYNNSAVKNTFGYDYALDIDWTNLSYKVYALGTTTWVKTGYYSQNQGSNPWQYVCGGTEVGGAGGTVQLYNSLSAADGVSFLGDRHYGAAFDLAFLAPGTDFTSHFTMSCGNDDLMGRGAAPVPEPATMLLLGSGLLALAGLGRRRGRK